MIAGADHLCFEPIAAEIDNPIKLKIIPTVSYTHLDVYKRQLQHNPW